MLQVKPQAPPLQVAVALATVVVQRWPQPPQLLTSVLGSLQVPPQLIIPEGHWQAPLTHTFGVVHVVPQAPQWLLSVCRLKHVPEQLVWPLGHTQAPLGNQVLVGLGVCSHDPAKAETVVFSDVTVEALAPPAGKKQ